MEKTIEFSARRVTASRSQQNYKNDLEAVKNEVAQNGEGDQKVTQMNKIFYDINGDAIGIEFMLEGDPVPHIMSDAGEDEDLQAFLKTRCETVLEFID